MNILMMSNTYTPIIGGVERSISGFSDQFRKNGHRVIVVTPEYKGQPEYEQDVVRLPAIQKFSGTDFSVSFPLPGVLSGLVAEFKPEIIHSHHPFLMGDLALRMAGQYNIPLVFTYHTMFDQYLHYLPVNNEKVKRFILELSTGYANLSDAVVVPSESVQELLMARGVTGPVHLIPTGVDVGRFSKGNRTRARQRWNIPEGDFVIGHVGRLEPEKNLQFLSRSVLEFLKKRSGARFLLVGKGSLEEKIRRDFEKYGMANRIHVSGPLQGQDLVDSYQAMDVFAFASHSETQGIVLLEAMAAGVPVAAVDAPGVREVMDDQQNGRMIESDDQDGFIRALEWIDALDEQSRARVRENARNTAKEFSLENCSHKMLDLYMRLRLANTPRARNAAPWKTIMNRIKTEWEMLKNLKDAGEAALKSESAAQGELPR